MAVSRLTFNTFNLSIANNLAKVQREYEQASVPVQTGYRLNNLSDDPTSISRLFSLKQDVNNNDQYQRNLTTAKLKLSFADDQLTSVNDLMSQVKDIALQANNSTISSSTLNQLSTQLGNLKTQLVGYGNAQYDNQYIFGGTATSTLPFSGVPTIFNGNSTAINVQANSTLQVQVNSDGAKIFTGTGGGQNLFALLDSLQTAVGAGDLTAITSLLPQLDSGLDQINQARADIGARTQQIDLVESSLSQDRLNTLSSLSDVQDVSIDQATTNLMTKETALRLVYASSNRLFSIIGTLTLDGK
ncbi:MAG: flagellar hook-associated protein FlgL [Deltaproteobacteria bacterium]|nr:flagellar hook-associated protein FlgL [Deltaproteobacteria bacterium]